MAQGVKNSPGMHETQGTWIRSLGREDPLEKEMQPTPVFLLEKSHGQRSLMGYSPWGHKELDMTEHACTNIAAQRLDKGPVLGIKLPPETFARIWAGCGGENVAHPIVSAGPRKYQIFAFPSPH